MKDFTQSIKLIPAIITVFISALIFYMMRENTLNFNYLILYPLLVIFSLVTIVFPVKTVKSNWPKYLYSPVFYTGLIVLAYILGTE